MRAIFYRRNLTIGVFASFIFMASYGNALNITMTDLGTLGGAESVAACINNRGEVTGFSRNAWGGIQAFIYRNGKMTSIAGVESWGYGINDRGDVVGDIRIGGVGPLHAFLYSNGTITELGTFGGANSRAFRINNSQQVIGQAQTIEGDYHAFIYSYSDGVMTDLGTLGGAESGAIGINNSGEVVGAAQTAGGAWHIFLYKDGKMTEIGTTLGGKHAFPTYINNRGDVVGESGIAGDGAYNYFLYSGGTMIDLTKLVSDNFGVEFFFADCINERGQIVGGGEPGGADDHAFILTIIP